MNIKKGTYPERDKSIYMEMAERLKNSDADWISTAGLVALKCYEEGELASIVVGRIVHEKIYE